MNLRLSSAFLIVLVLLTATAARSLAVGAFTRVDSFESGTGFSINGPNDHNLTSTPTLPSDSFSYNGPTLTIAQFAAIGSLESKLFIDVDKLPSYSEFGSSGTTARWDDMMTINAPGMTGQTGTFTMQMLLDANITYTPLTAENFSFRFEYGVNGATATSGLINALGYLPVALDDQAYSVTGTFTFGSPFAVYAFITNNGSQTSGSGLSDGQSKNLHSEGHARWNGITSILDAGSQPVSNFTVTSDSGFDYFQPVPEPSAGLALGVGGFVLLWLRPRWRRA